MQTNIATRSIYSKSFNSAIVVGLAIGKTTEMEIVKDKKNRSGSGKLEQDLGLHQLSLLMGINSLITINLKI